VYLKFLADTILITEVAQVGCLSCSKND